MNTFNNGMYDNCVMGDRHERFLCGTTHETIGERNIERWRAERDAEFYWMRIAYVIVRCELWAFTVNSKMNTNANGFSVQDERWAMSFVNFFSMFNCSILILDQVVFDTRPLDRALITAKLLYAQIDERVRAVTHMREQRALSVLVIRNAFIDLFLGYLITSAHTTIRMSSAKMCYAQIDVPDASNRIQWVERRLAAIRRIKMSRNLHRRTRCAPSFCWHKCSSLTYHRN